jgi:hypothetical protein
MTSRDVALGLHNHTDITLLEVFVKNVGKVSFAHDIRPLFRPVDIEHMKGMNILLDDYKYMSDAANQYANAQGVYDSLTGKTEPRMPPNGPYWSQDKLDLFQNWMKGGCQP